MQLQHLTHQDVSSVLHACRVLESEYSTKPSGEVVRAAQSTDDTYRHARRGLSNALLGLSDPAMVELQALAWFGRGDSGSDFALTLQDSKDNFDDSTREYLAAKSPLRTYIETGLMTSRAVLR